MASDVKYSGGELLTDEGERIPITALANLTAGAAITQTYATAARTHANPTATAHTYPASGNLFDAVAADLLINVRTDSTANAVADMVVNIKSLADNLNQAIADVANTKQVLNAVIDDLQASGLSA